MLASADEKKVTTATDVAKATGVPAWRIVLGNVAAGATAGCAVEAGQLHAWWPCCAALHTKSWITHSFAAALQHHDRYKKFNYTQLCNCLDTIMTLSQEQAQASVTASGMYVMLGFSVQLYIPLIPSRPGSSSCWKGAAGRPWSSKAVQRTYMLGFGGI